MSYNLFFELIQDAKDNRDELSRFFRIRSHGFSTIYEEDK